MDTRNPFVVFCRMIAVGAAIIVGGFSAPATDNMSIGSSRAPIVVAEYASVTCGHCAVWQLTVLPELKRRYVDTGWVRFEFRELITEPEVASAYGLMLARCVPSRSYFPVVDQLMNDQATLFGDGGLLAWLLSAGRVAGLDREQVVACTSRQDIRAALGTRILANYDSYSVEGTPTLLVNGKVVESDWASLEAAVEAERRAFYRAR